MFHKLKRAFGRPSRRTASTVITEEGGTVTEDRVKDSGPVSGRKGRFWKRCRRVVPTGVEESIPATLPSGSAGKSPAEANSKTANAVSPELQDKESGPTPILRHSLKQSPAQTDLLQPDQDSKEDAVEDLDRVAPDGPASSDNRAQSAASEAAAADKANTCLDGRTVQEQKAEEEGEEEQRVQLSAADTPPLKRSQAMTQLYSDEEILSITSQTYADPDTEEEKPDEPFPRTGTRISWSEEASVRFIPPHEVLPHEVLPREEPPVVQALVRPRPSQPKEPDIVDLLCCCFIPNRKKFISDQTHTRQQQLKDRKRRSEKRR